MIGPSCLRAAGAGGHAKPPVSTQRSGCHLSPKAPRRGCGCQQRSELIGALWVTLRLVVGGGCTFFLLLLNQKSEQRCGAVCGGNWFLGSRGGIFCSRFLVPTNRDIFYSVAGYSPERTPSHFTSGGFLFPWSGHRMRSSLTQQWQ